MTRRRIRSGSWSGQALKTVFEINHDRTTPEPPSPVRYADMAWPKQNANIKHWYYVCTSNLSDCHTSYNTFPQARYQELTGLILRQKSSLNSSAESSCSAHDATHHLQPQQLHWHQMAILILNHKSNVAP